MQVDDDDGGEDVSRRVAPLDSPRVGCLHPETTSYILMLSHKLFPLFLERCAIYSPAPSLHSSERPSTALPLSSLAPCADWPAEHVYGIHVLCFRCARGSHTRPRLRSLADPHTHRTGASRSLGLGYVEKLLASSSSVKVVAGARNPSNAAQLDALASKPENKGRVLVVAFDVDSEDSVRSAAEKLKTDPFLDGGALDAVVVNAGVFVGGHKPPSEMCVGAISPRRTQLTPLRGAG